MFGEFAKKKYEEYIGLIEFHDDKTSLSSIRRSTLPPYLINYFECSLDGKNFPIGKKETEDFLNKGLILYINFVIKPKATLLKFLFGQFETRPAEYILKRLAYFQFYSYYISYIRDFIILNQLPVVSYNQIRALIDEINRKLLEEISLPDASENQKKNLVKLLYHFFLDLTKNNPINIKLPKKVLSVFFFDKDFTELKTVIDNFFAEDIFIQEAIRLMDPSERKLIKKTVSDKDEKLVKEIVSKAKNITEEQESSAISITLIETNDTELIEKQSEIAGDNKKQVKHLKEIEGTDLLRPELIKSQSFLSEEIYSDDLLFASILNPQKSDSEKLTPEQFREKRFNEIFCEVTFRKKLIKKLFGKDETIFKNFILKLFSMESWAIAAPEIESYFNKNKIDYYSATSVKFVDLIESFFTEENKLGEQDSA